VAKLQVKPWLVLLEAANYANRSSLDQARIKTFILIGVSFAVSCCWVCSTFLGLSATFAS
jgi:hypothetical protein